MSEHGFALEVAHIIPYALANHDDCRELYFWKMMELFAGVEATNGMFAGMRSQINDLSNLVTLDNSIHSMFDNRRLTLTPITPTGVQIPIVNDHSGDYFLWVRYPKGMPIPELIQSTRACGVGTVKTLFPDCVIPMKYRPGKQSGIPTPPHTSYFALREAMISLRQQCLDD